MGILNIHFPNFFLRWFLINTEVNACNLVIFPLKRVFSKLFQIVFFLTKCETENQIKMKIIGVTSPSPWVPARPNCVTSNNYLPYDTNNIFLRIKMATPLGQQAFSAFSPEIALSLTQITEQL